MAITTPTVTGNTGAAEASMNQDMTDFANQQALLLRKQLQNITDAKAREVVAEQANSFSKTKDKFQY